MATLRTGAALRTAAIIAAMVAAMWLALLFWTDSIEDLAHTAPGNRRMDLRPLLAKLEGEDRQPTAREYETLFCQTGLGTAAVDQLQKENRLEELLQFQDDFFRDVEVQCRRHSAVIWTESLAEGGWRPKLVPLKRGDILVTPCSHFFGWRNGHAAIVVQVSGPSSGDQEVWEESLTLESITLGVTSRRRRAERWRSYPAFAVLRLKDGGDAGTRAAEIAETYFCDVPYRLSAGLWGKPWELPEQEGQGETEEAVATVAGTQCAHMIWSCYRALGYDLDSDGGRLVTPRDLLDSPLLEVVQIYGIEPKSLVQKNDKIL